MTLKENQIVEILRNYLVTRGFVIKNSSKNNSEHGCDIVTESHKKWRKNYYIEVKGEGTIKSSHPTKHNAFWTLFGQIISRMDVEGNHPDKGRIYAIAIPAVWEKTFKNKIKNMKFGWKLLKLKVFLVDADGKVEEKPYTYFLK
jgi:hypothetical protein